ncbi:2Fe-2S iron-sulfur cluster-binding protein [Mycobacterium sp.]|uniref:2Fe-2S iron-sulfur cluster-binding protein n=1 Tax=Mycobacterium sp. TaxID=1785 RepID=UPI003BAC8A88
MYFGARRGSSRVHNSICELKDQHLSTFSIVHVQSGGGYAAGMQTPAEFRDTLTAFGFRDTDRLAFYVFGEEEFVKIVRYSARALGWEAEVSSSATELLEAKPSPPGGHGTVSLRVRYRGRNYAVQAPAGKPCLGAIAETVHDIPFSCLKGLCGMCVAKAEEGKFQMRANYVLTERDIEDDYILTCQAVSLDPVGVIDFDV